MTYIERVQVKSLSVSYYFIFSDRQCLSVTFVYFDVRSADFVFVIVVCIKATACAQ